MVEYFVQSNIRQLQVVWRINFPMFTEAG